METYRKSLAGIKLSSTRALVDLEILIGLEVWVAANTVAQFLPRGHLTRAAWLLLNSQVLIPIYDELEWFIFSENYSIHNSLPSDCQSNTTCRYLILLLFHSTEYLLLLEENQVWQGSNVISLVRKIQQILGNFSPGWVHFVILQINLIKLLSWYKYRLLSSWKQNKITTLLSLLVFFEKYFSEPE